jgi:hypothetical protein
MLEKSMNLKAILRTIELPSRDPAVIQELLAVKVIPETDSSLKTHESLAAATDFEFSDYVLGQLKAAIANPEIPYTEFMLATYNKLTVQGIDCTLNGTKSMVQLLVTTGVLTNEDAQKILSLGSRLVSYQEKYNSNIQYTTTEITTALREIDVEDTAKVVEQAKGERNSKIDTTTFALKKLVSLNHLVSGQELTYNFAKAFCSNEQCVAIKKALNLSILLVLLFCCSFTSAQELHKKKIVEISAPIVLSSGEIYDGEGVVLVPKGTFTGPAFIVGSAETITNDTTVMNVKGQNFETFLVAHNTNDLFVTNTTAQGCDLALDLRGTWDTSIGPAFRSIQCGTVVKLHGTPDRYSNPTILNDCRFESWKNCAVDIKSAGNIIFTGCKFHGKKEEPPTLPSIVADSFNCVLVSNCLFMFNGKGHFKGAGKISIRSVITDSKNSIQVNGVNVAQDVLVNSRGK